MIKANKRTKHKPTIAERRLVTADLQKKAERKAAAKAAKARLALAAKQKIAREVAAKKAAVAEKKQATVYRKELKGQLDEIRAIRVVESVDINGNGRIRVAVRAGLINTNQRGKKTVMPPVTIEMWAEGHGYRNSLGFIGNGDQLPGVLGYFTRKEYNGMGGYNCLGDFSGDYRAARDKSLKDGVYLALAVIQTIY